MHDHSHDGIATRTLHPSILPKPKTGSTILERLFEGITHWGNPTSLVLKTLTERSLIHTTVNRLSSQRFACQADRPLPSPTAVPREVRDPTPP